MSARGGGSRWEVCGYVDQACDHTCDQAQTYYWSLTSSPTCPPHAAQALLEGLSGLEDSRLNYLEQHAGRLGVSTDKLDAARSAAARSSPLGDTLDLAAVRGDHWWGTRYK